jgi:hypothetical protein
VLQNGDGEPLQDSRRLSRQIGYPPIAQRSPASERDSIPRTLEEGHTVEAMVAAGRKLAILVSLTW